MIKINGVDTDRGTMAYHALCEALGSASHDKVQPVFKVTNHSVKLVVDGVELDFAPVMDNLQKNIDRMISEKALEIVQQQFGDVSNTLHNLEQDTLVKLREKLGLDPEENYD